MVLIIVASMKRFATCKFINFRKVGKKNKSFKHSLNERAPEKDVLTLFVCHYLER